MTRFPPAAPAAVLLTALPALLLLCQARPAARAAADEEPKPLKVVNLDCNTQADEDDPHVSSNNLMLFCTSNAQKKLDLMASKRASSSAKWPAPKSIQDVFGYYVHTPADDRSVFVTPDGTYPQYLYYATKLDEKGDNFDLYVTYRNGPTKDYAPPEAVMVVDTPADEIAPWLTKDGKTLYFSRKTKDGWRVFTATRKKATGGQGFEHPVLVDELPPDFYHATLTSDGGTMYLQGPLDKGRTGLFVSTKSGKTWGKPEALGRLNDPSGPTGDRSPCLSRDGATLYFASDRDGGKGGLDLYSVSALGLKKQ